MNDKSREIFEALCKIEGVSVAKDPEPVCYSSAKTRLALKFWRAGRKQAIEACVAACVDKASESDGDMNFSDGCHECADKIKELK